MSQHSSPPNKRQRVDDADDLGGTSEPATTRSPSLWFDDGNVVIQAEATQFRVHRSILSLHSDILADCFGLPQPEGEPTVDGCPLVHLADTVSELQSVFSIMYGNYGIYDHSKPLSFSAVKAMICLGQKYNFTAFQEEALRRLQREFPQDLNEWNKKRKITFTFLENTPGFIFDVVNFAFENSINSILPTAMTWLCTRYTVDDILAGVQLPDNQKVCLVPGALQMCLKGRYHLINVVPDYVRSIAAKYADFIHDCNNSEDCADGFRMFVSQMFRIQCTPNERIYPSQWQTMVDSDLLQFLCSSCGPKLTEVYDELRDRSWQRLPFYFGFDTWASLKDL